MTYYVDPGTTKGCAVARSFRGALVGLGMMQATVWVKTWGDMHWHHAAVVWEKPQLYPQELRSAAPQVVIAKANALIELAACGADTARALAGVFQIRAVRPREWKGQIPKPIHHGRAMLRLTPPELDLVRSAYSGTRPDKPRALDEYIALAAIRKAKNDDSGYKSEITDLLDAIALMLTTEGRL